MKTREIQRQLKQQLLRDYASGKTVQEIADAHGQTYNWVYQRLQPLPEFRLLRRFRRQRKKNWLQKKCSRCGELRLRNEFPPSHHWCKFCRRDYYREYHRRKK